tara:strand:- start:2514 stop:2939 length:426 start_codon:yes stop_codon:yes gene_type:complete
MTHTINYLSRIKGRLLLAVCLFTYTLGISQTEDANKNVGVLSFDTVEIDYGIIPQNADGARTFTFKNTGTAPIVISQVKTSCGCTVPSYSKTPVLPGETSEIQVKYATNRIGVFNKTITVMSNADEPNKLLHIKGEVKPAN